MKNKLKPQKLLYRNNKILFALVFLVSLIPITIILTNVFTGNFSFWYDPARDMLAGLSNLSKPTLIGPTSGIPGVFYGPYWIWFLSVGQLFSPDPKVVTFVVETLPYLLVFPFILFKMRKVFTLGTISILWLLFLTSYSSYFTNLWNPHLAPLFFLVTIYLLLIRTSSFHFKNLFILFAGGFSAGLVLNFHLSFGIGMMLGIIIYMVYEGINEFLKEKNKIHSLKEFMLKNILFGLGLIVSFSPFLLFELRHQFQQTQALLNALFSYGGVVDLPGLSREQIISRFFERGADLFQMSLSIFAFIFAAGLVYYFIKNRGKQTPNELKLSILVLSITTGILFIYLTANNPVWDYHFIGIEIIFLLAVGIIINKLKWIKVIIMFVVFLLIANNGFKYITNINKDLTKNFGTLAAKENVVEGIRKDAGSNDYTIYAANDAIYTYDYSYLFRIHAGKDVPYDPGLIKDQTKVMYLVIPKDVKNKEDFINFRGADTKYKTLKTTIYPDQTLVIKKEKRN